MSNWKAFRCWVVFVALLMFHPSAEAVETQDWNRMCLTFNPEDDPCHKLTDNPAPATKEAADLSCKMAFDALERSGGNSCRGWRLPECRRLEGSQRFDCSCVVSTCGLSGIKTHRPFLFRDCAARLQEEQKKNRGQPPPPSTRFFYEQEQVEEIAAVNVALQEAAAYGFDSRIPITVPNVRELLEGTGRRQGAGSSQAARTNQARRRQRDEGASSSAAGEPSAQRRKLTVYYCDICREQYLSEEEVEFHMKLHKGGTYCEFCGHTFQDKAALKAHYRSCYENYWSKHNIRSNYWSLY